MDSRITFRLLGMLEVRVGDTEVSLPQGKLRVLLASLLISANRLVSHTELAERLWEDDQPAGPKATIATYVMRLRRALGREETGRTPIRAHAQGYLIDVEPGQLDLLVFSELVEAARVAEDLEVELRLLKEALELWRGTPLADIDSRSLREEHSTRLEEQRLRVIERRIDVELALGNHAEVVGELAALTTGHPRRQRFCSQAMLALHRCGRQADALAAYAQLRSTLVEGLGLEPTADVRRLQEQILAEDPALDLDGSAVAERVPGRDRWSVVCQLPGDVEDLVSRDRQVDAISRWVESRRSRGLVPVVVVTGPAGVGKTVLAVHLAHRIRAQFPDGQIFVRLRQLEREAPDPADLLRDVLAATGLADASIPADLDARSAALRARMADRRVLLVLDDACAAQQVLPLLPGTVGSAVVVTSRSVLGDLASAHEVRLMPFEPAEAVEFLGRLVGADRVEAEPEAARRIALATGGLPLALRTVGARLARRPESAMAAFADRLSNQERLLNELAYGSMDIRSALRSTYGMLPADVAKAYRRLGLVGSLAVSSWVVGLIAAHEEPDRLIEQLVEANVLVGVGTDDVGEPRYRMGVLEAILGSEIEHAHDAAERDEELRHFFQVLSMRLNLALPPVSGGSPPDLGEPTVRTTETSENEIDRLRRLGLTWAVTENATIEWALQWCVRHGWTSETADLRALRSRISALSQGDCKVDLAAVGVSVLT